MKTVWIAAGAMLAGAEPSVLTSCVFGVCGLENGVMGWIKTNKDRQRGGTENNDLR